MAIAELKIDKPAEQNALESVESVWLVTVVEMICGKEF